MSSTDSVSSESRLSARVQALEARCEELQRHIALQGMELDKSQQSFQQLVAGVRDCAIYMLDRDGNIASWNLGAERIKGFTAQEIIGHHFSAFYTDEDRAEGVPWRALRAAAEEGKYEAEGWRVRKDGTRFWASVLIDSIRDLDGELIGYAKITRDMTEKRAMQDQLHQSQKMEAIGQLTGGVAHDFNNLLTVILGNLDTIERYIPAEDSRLRRAVEQGLRGVQRASTLTQQLLAFARRQPLNPKPTDVNRLVSNVSELIRRTMRENIAIETVLAGGVYRVEVDAHQLESALLNLAVNSRDAMSDGGTLTLETANAHLDDRYAKHYAEVRPGQYVVISISDTGIGMTPEVMARAFDPFFTTKPFGQGTGLGLSQVFGFVKQSGGHVKLYSEHGLGTTVKIYLPRLRGEALDDEEEREKQIPRGHHDETILVVEDDEDVRAFSADNLRELGYRVIEAHNGATALRILDNHADIALLFTDVGLPDLNGRELVDEVRRRRPDLKVLFTSGYARNAIVHQGRLDAGVELLTKPFTHAQLAARVREVIDSPQLTSQRRNVLVVDDEPLVRAFLADVLEELGYAVLQAGSAQEGMALSERIPDICFAFVDLGLPDRDGGELAAELRQGHPDLNVVIVTGYGDAAVDSVPAAVHCALLRKPFDLAAVEGAIATFEPADSAHR